MNSRRHLCFATQYPHYKLKIYISSIIKDPFLLESVTDICCVLVYLLTATRILSDTVNRDSLVSSRKNVAKCWEDIEHTQHQAGLIGSSSHLRPTNNHQHHD